MERGSLLPLAPLLVAAVLFLPAIGTRITSLEDEARYALKARTMLDTGDWFLPRVDGEVQMQKSPLFMWAIAVLSLPGRKVTELTATLPSALSAIAGVGATLLLGRRMFGARAGLLAAFTLATMFGYYWHARLILADMMMTFFLVAGAAAFWMGVGDGASRRGPLIVFWACLGLALSAKGPAGLLPLLPFGAFLVAERGWRRGIADLKPLMGAAVVVLVCAPWALAFALQKEQSYVQNVLMGDYLGPRRAGWSRRSEIFFTIGPIVLGAMPWTIFVPAAVRSGWWRGESDVARKFRFLVFWVLAYVIVITLMPQKRDRYLLPLFPALALMVGWLWDRWAAQGPTRTLRVHGLIWAALALGLAAAVMRPPPVRPDLAILVPSALWLKLLLGAVLIGAAVAAVVTARAGRALALFAVVCVATTLALACETQVFVAGHNRTHDVKAFTARLAARLGPGDQIVTYKLGSLSLQFYLGRTVRELQDQPSLAPLLAAGRPLYIIVHDRRWPELRDGSGRSWSRVDELEFGDVRWLVVAPVPQ
jgi:4-amino-4-deoxy-L-arabinose transferase-like glycosyltransferase